MVASWGCYLLLSLALASRCYTTGKSISIEKDASISEEMADVPVESRDSDESAPLDEKDLADDTVVETDIADLPDVLSSEDIEELEQKLKEEGNAYVLEKFDPLSMPTDFESYDVDKNGGITLKELKQVTGAAENLEGAFTACDTDGNGEIDADEFDHAPWRLQPFRSKGD